MSPTPRAAVLLGAIALSVLVVPLGLALLAALVLGVATLVDAQSVRRPPEITRSLPPVLSRGVPTQISVHASAPAAGQIAIGLTVPRGLELSASVSGGRLAGSLVARRRGRHRLPAVGVRCEGRLGLGAWYHRASSGDEVLVYPDLVGARRLARAAREGRLPETSRRAARGAPGQGSDFESVREWQPDDDIRHLNWRATQRMGRPMSNRFRSEQTREVIFLLDTGRLMAAPLGDERSRVDTALDALTAVALSADQLGDHCGAIAFDAHIHRRLTPRRGGGAAITRAFFDLQPTLSDSDYAGAFNLVARGKRALVMVLTDLFDDAAARALTSAVPVLSRRHAIVVAGVIDPDLTEISTTDPTTSLDVLRASAALELTQARERAVALITRAGAEVTLNTPERLPAACVRAYLRAKSQGRL